MRKALIHLLSKRAGREITTASGSDWLCRDIIVATGENISVNTVKRITGVLPSAPDDARLHASRTTLDIIARYLGFSDFRQLENFWADGTSQFRRADGLINVDELSVGARVVIRWNPDREIEVTHTRSGELFVERAENSKLAVGDRLQIAQLMAGYPLNVKSVIRGGEEIGPYTAAEEYGVTYVGLES